MYLFPRYTAFTLTPSKERFNVVPDTLMYCPNFSRIAYAHIGVKQAIAVRLRCGRWSCEYCSKKNASIWRAHLVSKLPDISQVWWLVTLTASKWHREAASSLMDIRKGVEALIKRAKRVFGTEMDYVRVYEKHPTSRAIHAHFIVSGFTPFVAIGSSVKHRPMAIGVLNRMGRNGVWSVKTWLKKQAQELRMGYMADIQEIVGDPIKAIGYVAKYLTKSAQDLGIKGLRHVQTTRKIGSPKTESNPEWKTAPYITPYTFEAGCKVIDLNTGEIIDNQYWEVHGFWPYD